MFMYEKKQKGWSVLLVWFAEIFKVYIAECCFITTISTVSTRFHHSVPKGAKRWRSTIHIRTEQPGKCQFSILSLCVCVLKVNNKHC